MFSTFVKTFKVSKQQLAFVTAVSLTAASASSQAVLPDWVPTMVDTAKTDIATLAVLTGAAIALVVGFNLTTKLAKSFVRKIG